MSTPLTQRIAAAARQAGAAAVGFVAAGEVDAEAQAVRGRWLEQGRHGSMKYLERWPLIRRRPALLLEEAPAPEGALPPPAGAAAADAGADCVLVVCAFSYYHPERQAPGAAPIAMYAHGEDYHRALRRRLEPVAAMLRAEGYRARICIDSAPLTERYWALRAGIGVRGRNGMLIVPQVGSYVFLATIVTDAPLAAGDGGAATPMPHGSDACLEGCLGCNRCVEACPGGAIRPGQPLDASRCLSYLTIEAPVDELPERLPTVYGCDICQSVCPHNGSPLLTPISEFRLRPALDILTPADIASLTPSAYRRLTAESPLSRRPLPALRAAALRYRP